MKKHIKKISRFGFMKSWIVASSLVMVIATSVGIYSMNAVSAASATLSMSPSTGSYTTGQTVTVTINENSGTEAVIDVGADFTYPTARLQFVSINGNSSGFGIDAGSSGSNGAVSISRGSITALTGPQQVAVVTFTALSAGSTALTFQPACVGSNDSNCTLVADASTVANIVSGTTGATFTLAVPTTPPVTTPPVTTPPASSTPPAAAKTPTAQTSQAKSSSTAITTPTTTTPVTVPNGSQVQVDQPVTVGPATVQYEGVSEVQYYLNNKLVHTSLAPPFSYKIDTTKLLNGSYTLKTKTVYSAGGSSTTNQTLHVKNPLSFMQAWLFFKKYLMIPLIIIVVILVGFLVFNKWKNKHNPFGKPTGHNGGGGDTLEQPYVPQPTTPVIKPTVVVG